MTVTIVVPTATSMKLKFPEFADLDDLVLEFAIEEARLGVNTNWSKGQDLALLYLAAHYVAAGQQASETAAGDSGEIASESIGRMSISYKSASTVNIVSTELSSSTYGKRYVELRGLNFGGPVIV